MENYLPSPVAQNDADPASSSDTLPQLPAGSASVARGGSTGPSFATLEPYDGRTVGRRSTPLPRSQTSANPDSAHNNDGWHLVSHRRKRDERRIRQIEAYNTLFHNPEPHFDRFFIIKFPVQNISTDLNVIKAETDIRSTIGAPRKILKHNFNSLLLETTSKTQSEKVLRITKIATMTVTISSFSRLNTERGIVRSKAMGQCTLEELLECLSDQGVTDIRRMKTRRDGALVDTDTYVLTFRTTTLPKIIKLSAWHSELVDEYVERPRQCFKCQKFGHVAKFCRQDSDTCNNCGEVGHRGDSCTHPPKCYHCHAPHKASDKQCPKFLIECEILKTINKEKTSRLAAIDSVLSRHPESVSLYESPTRPPVLSYSSAARQSSSTSSPSGRNSVDPPVATTTPQPTPSTSQSTVQHPILNTSEKKNSNVVQNQSSAEQKTIINSHQKEKTQTTSSTDQVRRMSFTFKRLPAPSDVQPISPIAQSKRKLASSHETLPRSPPSSQNTSDNKSRPPPSKKAQLPIQPSSSAHKSISSSRKHSPPPSRKPDPPKKQSSSTHDKPAKPAYSSSTKTTNSTQKIPVLGNT